VLLGSLAGAMQLLDAGIGLFEEDLEKCAGPLFIAVLQFFVVYLLHRSIRKPSADRLSPLQRRLRQIPGESCGDPIQPGLTKGQKQENTYEKRQGTDA
jgi:hypothetical protein